MKIIPSRHYMYSVLFIGFALADKDICAQNSIQYLSSSTGYVLNRAGNNTAMVTQWQGQKPIAQFNGYGEIKMDGYCLTGNAGNKVLTWEDCRTNDPGQKWGFERGRLRNERGWCADLEGGRSGANVAVLAWKCTGAGNQVWKAHYAVAASSIFPKITDQGIRQQLNMKVAAAPAGQRISLTPAEKKALVAAGGSGLIGLDGATLISAGGQNLIGLDGATLKFAGGRQ